MRLRFVAPPAWQPEIKVEKRIIERAPTARLGAGPARPARRADGAADAAHRPPQRPSRPDQLSRRPRRGRRRRRDRDRAARGATRRSASRGSRSRCSAACRPTRPAPASSSRRSSAWCSPGFVAAARSVRGRRGVRGAARLADESRRTTSATRSRSPASTREFFSMPWHGHRRRRAAAPLLHLGRDRGDAAQPLPLPRRLSAASAVHAGVRKPRRYDRPR